MYSQHNEVTEPLFKPSRFAPIHAEAPEFIEMSVEQEILVTGIKVVELLAPYAKGGKIGTLVVDTCFPNIVRKMPTSECVAILH